MPEACSSTDHHSAPASTSTLCVIIFLIPSCQYCRHHYVAHQGLILCGRTQDKIVLRNHPYRGRSVPSNARIRYHYCWLYQLSTGTPVPIRYTSEENYPWKKWVLPPAR